MKERLENLSDGFLTYLEIREDNETVPSGFWSQISAFFDGDITNNAARKRFKRRVKTLKKKDVKDRHDYINRLKDEFGGDETFLNTTLDILSGEATVIEKPLKDGTEHKQKTNFTEKAEELGVKSQYEKFLRKHGIDPDDVTNAYFKEKADGVRFTVQTRFDQDDIDFDPVQEFRDSIREYEIPDLADKMEASEPYDNKMALINLFDAHIEKVCSVDYSDNDATIEKNLQQFEDSFDDLLEPIKMRNVEKIAIPVGNDFFHTNDFRLTTKAGTEMADRVHVTGMEAFRIGLDVLRRCIDKARQIAPVKLIPVPGNHDASRIDYLLECLLLVYENQSDVEVMDNHRDRKYIRYGDWLLGFSHGDKNYKARDIPEIMSTDKESRKHWSDIEKAVFFLGHEHHERKYDYQKSQDFRGTKVMFLRSVGPVDEWHWENGYTAIPKTAYAFVFGKNGEREEEFKVNI